MLLLVGSQSITGSIGTIAALSIMGFMHLDVRIDARRRHRMRLVVGSTAVALVGIGAGLSTWVSGLLGKDGNFNGRTTIWRVSAEAWAERQLLGYGLNGVLRFSPPTTKTAEMWEEIGFNARHAHNGVLDVGLQLGLVGVVIVLALVVTTLVDAVRLLDVDRTSASWAIPLVVSLVCMSVSEDAFLGIGWVGGLVLLRVVVSRSAAVAAGRPSAEASPSDD